MKKSVESLKEVDLRGKRVLVRVNMNVPMDRNGKITDDTRIRAALPTIKCLIEHRARVILVARLGYPVVNALPEGEVVLLENLRLYKEELFSDDDFASKLASLVDMYVNEAFGTAHGLYASTEGTPFVAIVGGSKLSTKIGLIKSLMDKKVDTLLLGGGIIFTFLKTKGHCVASSLLERNELDVAKSIMAYAGEKNVRLLFPGDVMMADKHGANAMTKIVQTTRIPNDDWMGLDIGPDAIKLLSETLDGAKTIFWNGPTGVYEFDKFAAGTKAIAEKLAELSGKGVTT
ncbi:hypothetical protein RND71_030045 [Anisodus tanguticus]|uniref:Phosphoglycerate kinase n=1 Tax=Anisodus tanguticus TaxID=243964 RepID=A0AAE1RHG4_9SOLA|nr:hypothetical protein RND71_030045 [Anisodus tanguticus]